MKKVSILTVLFIALLASCTSSKFHTTPVKGKYFIGCGSGSKCLVIKK